METSSVGGPSVLVVLFVFSKQILFRQAATDCSTRTSLEKAKSFLEFLRGTENFESTLNFECIFCGKWALGALEGEWRALGRGAWWGTLRAC